MAKKVARRAVVRQKRRAYRQRLAARKAEAAAK